MWKQIKSPECLNFLEINEYGKIRDIQTKKFIPIYKDYNGYLVIHMLTKIRKKRYKCKTYKVHRLVAAQFIGDIPEGYEVHHLDFNKANPYYKNLVICSPLEHRRYHATTDKPVLAISAHHGDIIMNEETVHKVCKLLEEGRSFPYIREQLKLYNVTDDAIGKIAQGKNWKRIRSQYNIKIIKRSCMNSYSEHALVIAILRERGYRVREIAEVIGVEINSITDFRRLEKSMYRYNKWLHEGKWGALSEADKTRVTLRYKLRLYSPSP